MIFEAAIAALLGVFFLWVGYSNWRERDADSITIAEKLVADATGEPPSERTTFDRISRRIQAVLGLVFGGFCILIAVAFLISGD